MASISRSATTSASTLSGRSGMAVGWLGSVVIEGSLRGVRGCYPARTVRLIEIRLLEGPNVYRLEPVVKLEVAIGRRRTWFGQRDPGRHAIVRLGARVPSRDWPEGIVGAVAWIRRLRAEHGEGRAG